MVEGICRLIQMIRQYIADHGGTPGAALCYFGNHFYHSNFVRKVFQTYGNRLLMIGFGLVGSVLTARLLGPEGRGYLGTFWAVAGVGVQFINFGLQSSNTYYIAKDKSILPQTMGNSLAVGLGLGAFTSLFAGLFFWIWPQLSPLPTTLLILSLTAIPLGLTGMFLQNILLGLGDVRYFNLIELFGKILTVLVLGLLFWWHRVDVLSVSVLSLGISLFTLVWYWVKSAGHLKGPLNISWDIFRDHLRYGFKAYVAAFFGFLLLRVDILMVQYISGPKETGYYSMSSTMADYLYLLPMTVGTILFPNLSSLPSKLEMWKRTKKVCGILTLVFIPGVLFSIILAKPIVLLLYGTAFEPAVFPYQILACAMIFYGINTVLSNFLAATGFPWFAVYVWIAALFVNVGLNLFLIPRYGPAGASWASLVGYFLVFVLQYQFIVGKEMKEPVKP